MEKLVSDVRAFLEQKLGVQTHDASEMTVSDKARAFFISSSRKDVTEQLLVFCRKSERVVGVHEGIVFPVNTHDRETGQHINFSIDDTNGDLMVMVFF